jgi:hypothetical protein
MGVVQDFSTNNNTPTIITRKGQHSYMNRIVSRRSKPNSHTTFIGKQLNPWYLLQPQDVIKRVAMRRSLCIKYNSNQRREQHCEKESQTMQRGEEQ